MTNSCPGIRRLPRPVAGDAVRAAAAAGGALRHYALSHGCPELRMDTNARNAVARGLYKKLGYKEIGIVPTEFNGIPDVQLVLLEKHL